MWPTPHLTDDELGPMVSRGARHVHDQAVELGSLFGCHGDGVGVSVGLVWAVGGRYAPHLLDIHRTLDWKFPSDVYRHCWLASPVTSHTITSPPRMRRAPAMSMQRSVPSSLNRNQDSDTIHFTGLQARVVKA